MNKKYIKKLDLRIRHKYLGFVLYVLQIERTIILSMSRFGTVVLWMRFCPLKDRKQSDVWEILLHKVSEEHWTMKSISLAAKTVLNSSYIRDLALDLFGSTGTTMISAQQIGRICFMMECQMHYNGALGFAYDENI